MVTDQQVQETILQGLGGGDGDQEVIDMMELVALLQIPVLVKGAYGAHGKALPKGVVPAPDKLLEFALKIILHDVSVVGLLPRCFDVCVSHEHSHQLLCVFL